MLTQPPAQIQITDPLGKKNSQFLNLTATQYYHIHGGALEYLYKNSAVNV